jgi:UDP-N-acetylglucosamine 2-epimerase (non-hydrolysing)/GDP/UDP-N,N'-diacetylbacillosamine 2-epimerase (hydrolysing)
MVLLLGDRYEILAAALAANLLRMPVAHIAGGDISEGAIDDAMRHVITKLAHLHFATNAPARQRVLQMGESADRVFDCGSPGIDAILSVQRWDRTRLEQVIGFRLRTRNLAITFHPATLDPAAPEAQVAPLLEALERIGPDFGLVFTGANADAGGARINARLSAFVATHDNACLAVSLGHTGYYSLLEQVDLVVGNSSSGLYEAPSLGTPTVDIGIRQQGRLRGPSVRQVPNDAGCIADAIQAMLDDPPTDFSNPYGQGSAASCIAERLLAYQDPCSLLIKRFHEVSP